MKGYTIIWNASISSLILSSFLPLSQDSKCGLRFSDGGGDKIGLLHPLASFSSGSRAGQSIEKKEKWTKYFYFIAYLITILCQLLSFLSWMVTEILYIQDIDM